MLTEETLFGQVDKVKIAINRLRLYEPDEGYYVAFSGGKDSCVVYDLCKRAGVKFDAHYAVTTVDPPELIYFIRKHYPECWDNREKPKDNMSMWKLIEKKMLPPSRVVRYCCQYFKEGNGKGRKCVVTGVRAAESARRAKRKIFEPCFKNNGTSHLHPIFDWSTEEVWEYIHQYHLPYCELYDRGHKRIGCIMCPFNPKEMQKDVKRYPKYAKLYRMAIEKGYKERVRRGMDCKLSPEETWDWWLNQRQDNKEDDTQIKLFGLYLDESDT